MLKKYKFNRWQIAYRMKGEKQFTLLSNPGWGWAADPFPVVYQGVLYIFAEVYLYKSERNGVIAYCRYENGAFTDWQVSMDKHWHISYPNVFVRNDKLYMCPETWQNDEIAIYELTKFPDQWKKTKVLLSNVQCVDTTFCTYHQKSYMFTFQHKKEGVKRKLYLYQIENGNLLGGRVISEDTGTGIARPGGKIICQDGKLYLVSQDGSKGYGSGLVFSEIDSFDPVYQEHEVQRITAQEIDGKWERKFVGIHTYNRIDEVEVIDLKYQRISLTEYFARKRVRKVFMDKFRWKLKGIGIKEGWKRS